MEAYTLQPGDTVYQYGNYGIYDSCVVMRVTPKVAFLSNNAQLSRHVEDKKYSIRIHRLPFGDIAGLSWYLLETEKLKKEWRRHQILKFLKESFHFSSLSDEQLEAINLIINPDNTLIKF